MLTDSYNIWHRVQGGPAKVRPTYNFDGYIKCIKFNKFWVNVIIVTQAHTLRNIKV